jgi:hypothetical protein
MRFLRLELPRRSKVSQGGTRGKRALSSFEAMEIWLFPMRVCAVMVLVAGLI